MLKRKQLWSLALRLHPGSAILTLALAMICGLALIANPAAHAQTFKVIHSFTAGGDGANPKAGVSIRAGILYGTASTGGIGQGTVYQAMLVGSNWITIPISLLSAAGNGPRARVVFGPDGHPYGTAQYYSNGYYWGIVFDLIVPLTICKTASCFWTENDLHDFTNAPDGAYPGYGDLIWDATGHIYGTTVSGGYGSGTVFEMTKSGNTWTEIPIYSFAGSDGSGPQNAVIFDTSGDLFGTTKVGARYGAGNVFELTYYQGVGWIENTVYNFQNEADGGYPIAGLAMDGTGNLYGATSDYGSGGGGTIFELVLSNGNYTFTPLYSLSGMPGQNCGPWATLAMDPAGSLYGTTYCGGALGYGSIFKLTKSGNTWNYTDLHDFSNGNDGAYPVSNVTFDANGNLYGTASAGGSQGFGVVWQIKP